MKITGKHLFPLAKFIVETQQKKLSFVVDNLVVVEEPKADNIGGFYDHKSKTIGLNISGLAFLRNKYEIDNILRVAVAVVLEECYHAAHHGEACNKEDLAAWYGASQSLKLPEELLTTQGGQLYKNVTINKKETKMILKDIPATVVAGSMFEFVNKVKNFQSASKQETTYGTIELENGPHASSVVLTTNQKKLDALKDVLGNVPRASIEYAGVIYVYDVNNEGWKTYVDVDDTQMVEVSIKDTLHVHLTKHEEGEHLEVVANDKEVPF